MRPVSGEWRMRRARPQLRQQLTPEDDVRLFLADGGSTAYPGPRSCGETVFSGCWLRVLRLRALADFFLKERGEQEVSNPGNVNKNIRRVNFA